jgi:hypothetical protein
MTLNDVKAEIQNRNYTKALLLMEELSEVDKTAEFYLIRGICIQLPNKTNLGISEAEYSLRKAVELDPNYKDAKLELAYFLLNVMHDPSSAKKYFLEVLQATRDEIPTGLSSLMETSQELKETNSAFVNTLKMQAETFLSQMESRE